jgi:ferredoxin
VKERHLAYVITEACAGSECSVCLEVCPVDAIHPRLGEPGFFAAGPLSINADTCIHCDSCSRVCPLKAAIAGEEPPPLWARLNAADNASIQF